VMLGFWLYHFGPPYLFGRYGRTFLMLGVFTHYLAKGLASVFFLLGDLWRGLRWSWEYLFGSGEKIEDPSIVDSAVSQIGLAVGTLPIFAIGYGVITGAHDYRVRRRSLYLPNLPEAFDGLKIAQISDIHAGSFWSPASVAAGVKLLMAQQPDVVFFTGDLVNNEAKEMRDYVPIFSEVKAPMGVYSILGNHDYGDYVNWPNKEAKAQNLHDLTAVHRAMGWDLLRNEHRLLEKDGQQIAVIGVENWSAKPQFPKHGNLPQAYAGTEAAPVKILLSHDPSHWDAEVTRDFQDIDLTLSGHTHGMQFGLELPKFKWSPVQYMYPRWSDLHQEGEQYLYVNRGFGYLGFPGRIGMPPEITILELKKG
jgi:predicted MPP superfamily phosphohydrolase